MKPTLISNLETGKEPIDATLQAFAALAWTAGNQVPIFTGTDVFGLRTVGQGAGNILDKAAGDALYQALGSYQPLDGTLTALAGASWAAGTQVLTLTANDVITLKTVGQGTGNILDKASGDALYQALSANLTAYAGAAWSAGLQIPTLTAANTIALKTVGSSSGNILDKASGDILYQPVSANLTGLSGLSATLGLLEQTGTNTFTKRSIGVTNTTDILQRSDGDARFTAIAHGTSALTASGHTVSVSARLLGRNTAGSGAVEELTGTTTTALLDLATGSLKGLMSASDFTKLAGIASGATANTGTVTSVSVATQNGVSAIVTNAGTTPSLAFTLGAITPTTIVASSSIQGSSFQTTDTQFGVSAGVASVSGAGSAFTVATRDSGSAWSIYNSTGSLRLYQGSDLATFSSTGLKVVGNVGANNINVDVYTRAITATVADVVNVCTINQTNLSTIAEVVVSIHTTSYKQTKVYVVPLKSNQTGTNWHRLVPLLNSEGSDNVELDAQVNGDTATFRLRRTAGTNAATAQVSVNLLGDISGTTLAGSSTTGSAGSVTQDYILSSLEQLSNNSVRVKNLEMRGQPIPTFTIYNDQTLAGSILVENGGIKAISNGGPLRLDTANSNAVLIGHNGATVFNTIGSGVEITGDVNTKNNTGGINVRKGDSTYVGSIKVSTNDLLTNSSGINKQDGDFGVILSHAASTKLATLSTGIGVTGTLSATGTLSGSNFSGSSSGTNTGDETSPTILSKLSAASGGGTTNYLRADGTWVSPTNPGFAAFATAGTGASQNITIPVAATSTQLLVFINGIYQTPDTNYTVSGTTVTITTPAAGDNIVIGMPGTGLTGPAGTGGGGTWGSITGTLSAQTDLQTALNAKAALAGATFTGAISAANLSGTNTGDQTITLTGDVTGTGTGSFAATVAAGAITLAKQANLAANSIQGNNTGSSATPLALTGTQVTAMLDSFTSSLKGLVPPSGGGTTTYLRADGTWSAPPGGGGTVTAVSVTTVNGVSGTVATASTTPAISLTLGAITPSSVAATGTVSGSNLSGTNTGDQNLTPYALLASPAFTGTPTVPNALVGDSSTAIANTVFVQSTIGSVGISGTGGVVNLGGGQVGAGLIILTGALTSNMTVNFGTGTSATFNRPYTFVNNTTGAFTVSLQACASSPSNSLVVSQGTSTVVYTSGSSIFSAASDLQQLGLFSSTLKGLVPASGGGTTNFLRADGTWVAPAGGGGTTTNALTLNNSGTGAASGTTFNGGSAVTLSYNTIGAAPTASPTFTGTPAAPTATADTNTTQLATTAFVQTALGTASISTTGGNTTLTTAQAAQAVIYIGGTLTSNATIYFGTSAGGAYYNTSYVVYNNTTGAFTVSLVASSGAAGLAQAVPQGVPSVIATNSTAIVLAAAPTASPTFTGTVVAPTINNPGGTTLQYNGSNRFSVNSPGALVTGTLQVTTGIDAPIINSSVSNTVALQYSGATKLSTSSTGVGITGNANVTGNVITGIVTNGTQGVQLQYNSITRLQTVTGGVSVIGAMAATGAVSGTTITGTGVVSGSNIYQGFKFSVGGKSLSSERFTTSAEYAFTATTGASSAYALVAATASTVFTIKKGTVASPTTIGTFTFAASGTVATVSITAGAIAVSDIVWIECPATPDTTLADMVFTVRA